MLVYVKFGIAYIIEEGMKVFKPDGGDGRVKMRKNTSSIFLGDSKMRHLLAENHFYLDIISILSKTACRNTHQVVGTIVCPDIRPHSR
jgi:DNA-dependent RNA polymerase auxiliary subunit epsilon